MFNLFNPLRRVQRIFTNVPGVQRIFIHVLPGALSPPKLPVRPSVPRFSPLPRQAAHLRLRDVPLKTPHPRNRGQFLTRATPIELPQSHKSPRAEEAPQFYNPPSPPAILSSLSQEARKKNTQPPPSFVDRGSHAKKPYKCGRRLGWGKKLRGDAFSFPSATQGIFQKPPPTRTHSPASSRRHKRPSPHSCFISMVPGTERDTASYRPSTCLQGQSIKWNLPSLAGAPEWLLTVKLLTKASPTPKLITTTRRGRGGSLSAAPIGAHHAKHRANSKSGGSRWSYLPANRCLPGEVSRRQSVAGLHWLLLCSMANHG